MHPERVTTADNVQEKGSINYLTAYQYSTTQQLEVKAGGRTRLSTSTAHVNTKIAWGNLPDEGEESSEGGSEAEDPILVPSLRCGVVIHRIEKDGICGRANTLASYRELNQNVCIMYRSFSLVEIIHSFLRKERLIRAPPATVSIPKHRCPLTRHGADQVD